MVNERNNTRQEDVPEEQKVHGVVALAIMVVTTIAVLVSPGRFASAEAILMMMYGSLSALVASYFGFSNKK